VTVGRSMRCSRRTSRSSTTWSAARSAVRGGTYRPTARITIATSGTAQRHIVLSNYRDERPVIDASATPNGWFITQTASYWTVQGLEIRNGRNALYVCESCGHNVFRRLNLHDSADTALTLRGPDTIGNEIVDSDFYLNHDVADNGGNADGLAIKFGSGGRNVVRGCRIYQNSGDGLDLTDFTDAVTITGTWAYGNGVNRWDIEAFSGGGNGFKLGGGEPGPRAAHVVTNSAAWDNGGYGFTESGNLTTLTLTNNTAYRNGKAGFALVNSTSKLRRKPGPGQRRP
jgi:hypothetical protein